MEGKDGEGRLTTTLTFTHRPLCLRNVRQKYCAETRISLRPLRRVGVLCVTCINEASRQIHPSQDPLHVLLRVTDPRCHYRGDRSYRENRQVHRKSSYFVRHHRLLSRLRSVDRRSHFTDHCFHRHC